MATDAAPGASKRPRPILLIMLGVVVAAFLLMRLGGSADPNPAPSNPARAPQQPAQAGTGGAAAAVEPSALDVHLESLEHERPAPGESERNPFRFQPKAPPPAPPPTAASARPAAPPEPTGPPPPPPPPPITVKFVGTIERADGSTLAVITDCTTGHKTVNAREGEAIFGQYRLVKIGLQSVVVEHLDGKGRTTLAKNGQECVWK